MSTVLTAGSYPELHFRDPATLNFDERRSAPLRPSSLSSLVPSSFGKAVTSLLPLHFSLPLFSRSQPFILEDAPRDRIDDEEMVDFLGHRHIALMGFGRRPYWIIAVDLETREVIGRANAVPWHLEGHRGTIRSLCALDTGWSGLYGSESTRLLASASVDSTIRIWNLEEEVDRREVHSIEIAGCQFGQICFDSFSEQLFVTSKRRGNRESSFVYSARMLTRVGDLRVTRIASSSETFAITPMRSISAIAVATKDLTDSIQFFDRRTGYSRRVRSLSTTAWPQLLHCGPHLLKAGIYGGFIAVWDLRKLQQQENRNGFRSLTSTPLRELAPHPFGSNMFGMVRMAVEEEMTSDEGEENEIYVTVSQFGSHPIASWTPKGKILAVQGDRDCNTCVAYVGEDEGKKVEGIEMAGDVVDFLVGVFDEALNVRVVGDWREEILGCWASMLISTEAELL